MAAPSERPAAYDLGRRIAAARAYREVDQKAVADEIGVGRDTLGRYEKGQIPPQARAGAAEGTARATQLPREFFSIDFSELPAMVRAWRQRDPATLRLEQEAEVEELLAEEDAHGQPSSPNEEPNEEQDDEAESPG